jgi:hypothetical protein
MPIEGTTLSCVGIREASDAAMGQEPFCNSVVVFLALARMCW